MTPAPRSVRQQVVRNLSLLLHEHVRARGLGEVLFAPIDCVLSDITVVQPDIVCVEAARRAAISSRGIEGPPILAGEILFPATLQVDRVVKLQLYARHGVAHDWIVDPEARVIEAYGLTGGSYELHARLQGDTPATLSPFSDLTLVPASIWP